MAVQLIFLRVGEIHLNKNVCTAVHWAELCPAGISGTSLLWRQDSVCDQSSDSWFPFFMPLPLLLFLLAPFPFEDSLAFQWGEWAWKCLNCSRSMFFLSFSAICRACDTLFLFSWPTVFCQQCYLWEQREHGQLPGSVSEGLEEDLWAAESQGLSVPIWQTLSLWLGDFNPMAPHCSGTSVPWVCSLFWQDKGTSSQGMRIFFHRNYLKPLVGEDGEKKG